MNVRKVSLLVLLPLALLTGIVLWHRPEPEPEPVPSLEEMAGATEDPAFAPFVPGGADAANNAKIPLPEHSRHAIPGEYTVFFESEADMQAFMEQAAANGLTIVGSIDALLALRVAGRGQDLQKLLKEGMGVDLNIRVQAPVVPNLELWPNLNLKAVNSDVLNFLGIGGINHLQWGKGVTVAVLDTGWKEHPAVRGNAVREINLIEALREGDYSGHGSAVVGLISSTTPFAPGIAPGSDILAIRVLDGEGLGDSFTLAQGIIAALDNGADIINMSLGSYQDSQVLREAIEYAARRGVVLVAASGNDGSGIVTYPAAYGPVIGVAAVDAEGNRAPFSNYGEGIDISAPGYQVHALWDNGEFIYFDGTSASAPLVAGMAARMLQSGIAGNAAEVTALLMEQANETGPPGDDIQYGAGILNAQRIEDLGKSGIYDIALADLYPAIEQSDGSTFPLYATIENRGTDFIAGATVELLVNGTPYYYRFSGLSPGRTESVQIPISETRLDAGESIKITASVELPAPYEDARPANDAGDIILSKPPPEE